MKKKYSELTKDEEKSAIRLHEKEIIIDALNTSRGGVEGFQAMIKGGLTTVNITVHNGPFPPSNFRQKIGAIYKLYKMINDSRDIVMQVTSVNEIKMAKRERKVGIIFGFQNSTAIESDVNLLMIFYRLGVRIMQPTYNERNLIGAGCRARCDSGISNFGVEVLTEMNRLGILIDLSHMGRKSFYDSLEISKEPVIVSHSNVYSICNFVRNIDDEQLKALAEKWGVIGIIPSPHHIRLTPGVVTIDDFLDQVDYIVDLVGVNYVGISSDMSNKKHEMIQKEDIFQKEGAFKFPPEYNGFSKRPNVTKGLVARGYSDQEIEKINGGNFLRIFNKVWK